MVSRDIRRILTQRAYFFNIVLDDVSITQLTFSREYTSAVEAKQVAQQDSERAKFIVRARPPSPCTRITRGISQKADKADYVEACCSHAQGETAWARP